MHWRTTLAAGFSLAAVLAPGPVLAGSGNSASGSASAAIIQPITVRALEDLLFGTLAVGPDSGGAITVDPATGAVSYSGALRGVCGAGGCTAHPALFGVTGEPGRRYRIAAPASAAAVPVSGNGPALPVSAITVSADSLPGDPDVGLLDAGGADRFTLGGTLQVAPGSSAGFYRAEVAVVVTYD
jgi:hypothetical protein